MQLAGDMHGSKLDAIIEQAVNIYHPALLSAVEAPMLLPIHPGCET